MEGFWTEVLHAKEYFKQTASEYCLQDELLKTKVEKQNYSLEVILIQVELWSSKLRC